MSTQTYGQVPSKIQQFSGTPEAAKRRVIREAIRHGDFTKSERDVILAVVNMWFHRKGSAPQSFRFPRAYVAKRASVAKKTVSRCFVKLREAGVLIGRQPVVHGQYVEAEYSFHLFPLFQMCGCKIPEVFSGELVAVNVPRLGTSTGGQNVPPYINKYVESHFQHSINHSRPALRLIQGGVE